MGGVNQHELGEFISSIKFFNFNGSHTNAPLYVKVMSLLKYFLK